MATLSGIVLIYIHSVLEITYVMLLLAGVPFSFCCPMCCISTSPVHGYKVNVLPNAVHLAVDLCPNNFRVDYLEMPLSTRVAGSPGDVCWVYPVHSRGTGTLSKAVAAFTSSLLATCTCIPPSPVGVWIVFRHSQGQQEQTRLWGSECPSSQKLFLISSDGKTTGQL